METARESEWRTVTGRGCAHDDGKAADRRQAQQIAALRRSAAYRLLAADPRNELHAAGNLRTGHSYLSLAIDGQLVRRAVAWRTALKLILGGFVVKVGSGQYRLAPGTPDADGRPAAGRPNGLDGTADG